MPIDKVEAKQEVFSKNFVKFPFIMHSCDDFGTFQPPMLGFQKQQFTLAGDFYIRIFFTHEC